MTNYRCLYQHYSSETTPTRRSLQTRNARSSYGSSLRPENIKSPALSVILNIRAKKRFHTVSAKEATYSLGERRS